MKCLHGRDFGYPLLNLAEAYAYRSAFSVGWERHAVWEIHCVLSGIVVYEFEGRGSLELHGGTFLAIPPRVRHRTQNGSAAPATRLAMRWSPLTPGLRQGQSPLFLSKREIAGIFSGLARSGIRAHAMSAPMRRAAKALLEDIGRAGAKPKGFDAAILRHRCNDMLINLALVDDVREPLANSAAVVPALKDYVERHLGEKLRMGDLMRISGYGSTRLTTLFLEKTGVTPKGYIVRARIEHARSLLKNSDLNLAEIAAACGFPSASYFSTVFRKYCGSPPSAGRKSNKVKK